MTRKCSHCGQNGHNSRTCPNRGVKIFGVRLIDGPLIRKSASMGNLSHCSSSSSSAHATSSSVAETPDASHSADGYLSDGLVHNSSSSNSRSERKKGVPWTEEEHRMFLIGLQKLGKGDWRGISRNYVPSRTPTQVASHAQKYFIRQTNLSRRKRRSSLFDMTAEPPPSAKTSLALPLSVPSQLAPAMSSQHSNSDHEETESVEKLANCHKALDICGVTEEMTKSEMTGLGGFASPYLPYGFPVWFPLRAEVPPQVPSVYRPTAVVPRAPMKVDDCSGLSELSLEDATEHSSVIEPSELSLKLHDSSGRQSAFQATPPLNQKNGYSATSNVISVV
eukprot:TRINITY_DN14779_c0_g1_i1.p1 TRINITY_DN14779_c0_g1~~TRINITY_DN14779_c0_g1_i1.p1  ORF type:complete len:335 (+),score=38.27 TRINITY_DN14779_c0_g1_i1:301-1305(+)